MDTNSNKLVVLGAGWLGRALCLNAVEKGWQVQGTHRSSEHDADFLRQLVLEDDQLIHQVDLVNAFWVCAIPPRSRSENDSNNNHYLTVLEKSLQLAQKLNCKGFILCSSTGIYNTENDIYNENRDIDATTLRQQRLFSAEKLVMSKAGKILRLGGLLGPNREPGRFVAGKELSSSSQQVVNMVHQQDVISAIYRLIECWHTANDVYNVVNPSHPTKVQYYTTKSQQLGTQMPTFKSDEVGERLIDGSVIESLGFSYQHGI